MENIIIKDTFSKSKSKIIYAKRLFSEKNKDNFLILINGKILNINVVELILLISMRRKSIYLNIRKNYKDTQNSKVNTKNLFQCFSRNKYN